MAANKSLSTQEVADMLHVSKSTIYELIRRGEINSYKIGRKVRFTQDDVDAYIARSRHEHSTQPVKKIDTGSTLLNPEEPGMPDIIISGQDVVLDILANYLQQQGIRAGRTYLSSFEGLLALYQDRVDAAACHLFDGRDFNTGFAASLVPGISTVLINVSYRKRGFYVRRGNPRGVKGWEDLAREDISILNRRPGSSSRILLDTQLKRLGVEASSLKGYDRIMGSHLTMAAAIAAGEADVAIGTERVSRQMDGIDFIPLMEERFDIAIKKQKLESLPVVKLIEILNSQPFRREISRFSGNDYRDSGKIIAEV